MKVDAVRVFGPLLVLVEKAGVNLTSTNRKLRLEGGDIQISILPSLNLTYTTFKGEGSMRGSQSLACGHRCEFRVGMELGGCYVNHLNSKSNKVKRDKGLQLEISPSSFVRATVWGDIGRLNFQGQHFILSILSHVKHRTAYISDFAECLPEFREFAQASCQTSSHVKLALALGWSVYVGTLEAKRALESMSIAPVYKCPVKGNGQDKFGCRTCKIGCNGKRNVVAHSAR